MVQPAPENPPPPPRLIGRRNLELLTYGPVKLWASGFRDDILPLVATHYGGDLDAARERAMAWVAQLDEQNRVLAPSKDAVAKPREWWRARAAETWAVEVSAADDPWIRGGNQ